MKIEIKEWKGKNYKTLSKEALITIMEGFRSQGKIEMYFDENAHDSVCQALFNANLERRRLRVYYGDKKTGRCWNDEYDTMGVIGKSTGPIKTPLMIRTSRSIGGTGVLTGCIVAIQDVESHRFLYKHHSFHTGSWGIKEGEGEWAVTNDGAIVARFESRDRAEKYISFMNGDRMRTW